MKILKFNEFISEKLNIKPVTKDGIKKAVNNIPKFYMYMGNCGDKNDVGAGDILISERPLPQYDNNEFYKNKFIGVYRSFDEVKKMIDNKKDSWDKSPAVFSKKLKDYALKYYRKTKLSDLFKSNHCLFDIDFEDCIYKIYKAKDCK